MGLGTISEQSSVGQGLWDWTRMSQPVSVPLGSLPGSL